MKKWRNDFNNNSIYETYYDLFEDWDLIACSLKTQYGYSIRREIDNLSWGELSSDIAGLSEETPLGNIIRIRNENDPEILKRFSKEEKRIRSEWRNRNAKKVKPEDYEQAMEGLKNMFISMAEGK